MNTAVLYHDIKFD